MHVSFTAALAAIDEMAPPLQSTILANPAPAQRAHQRFQELQRALNTEVVILLGVSVGFSDTEGTVVKGPASPSVRAAGQNPPLGAPDLWLDTGQVNIRVNQTRIGPAIERGVGIGLDAYV